MANYLTAFRYARIHHLVLTVPGLHIPALLRIAARLKIAPAPPAMEKLAQPLPLPALPGIIAGALRFILTVPVLLFCGRKSSSRKIVYPILIALALLPCTVSAQLKAREETNKVTLENEQVRAIISMDKEQVKLQFFAKTAGGWQFIAESFRPPDNYPATANPLLNSSLNPHRYLISRSTGQSVKLLKKDSREVSAIVRSHLNGMELQQTISLKAGEENFHVDVKATLPGRTNKLEYLLSTFRFAEEGIPEFVHSPTLKYDEERWETPAQDQILGDRSFHSPAIILQDRQEFFALVPDLNAINDYRILSPDARRTIRIPVNKFSVPLVASRYTMPTAMDLNVQTGLSSSPVVTFGFMDYIIQHHIRYLHPNNGEMVRTLETSELRYAFNLFVSATKQPGRGFMDISAFIWKAYGRPVFQKHRHLAMPFTDYAKTVSGVIFNPMEVQPPVKGFADTGDFLEFEINGLPVGGFRTAIPGWTDALWNSVFWNNTRDAVGVYLWGKRLNDTSLQHRARRMINLVLSSPQNEQGLFPLIYRAASGKWQTAGYDIVNGKYGLFSAGPESETYDITAMSKTCAHLVDYYKRCEKDQKIIDFATRYADWLAATTGPNGMLPSYVSTDMQASEVLRFSAQPAATMWFLAELYTVTQKTEHLQAAKRIATFLQKEILPQQRWIDLEQYFSCGIKSISFTGDREQGQPARGNLSVGWAAEGFAALYRATGEKNYLSSGEACIDYLSFTQCSWNPHYIYTAYPFGGFTVDNSDHATYLDARQAEYVKPMIWYGKELGRSDLIERGVAAARSSVVLINHPRHKMNGIYEYTNVYSFGLGPENIDHEGHPQSAMRTHASWGEGSGIFTGLSEAIDALEGIYVDLQKNIAVGVDGVSVQSFSVRGNEVHLQVQSKLSELELPYAKMYPVTLRIDGPGVGEKFTVYINGKKTGTTDSTLPLLVKENGDIELRK